MRLQKIDPEHYPKLGPGDECYHLGEYTAYGGYKASETNQQIFNLQKKPSVPPAQLRWKEHAINYWGDKLAGVLGLETISAEFTLIPAPPSKPPGAADYDDRILRVLNRLRVHRAGLDIRPVLYTPVARQSQHAGGRLTVAELQASLALDQAQLATPLRSKIIVVDDVFTQGGTFKSMKNILAAMPGVQFVAGVFLAKAVWTEPDFTAIFGPFAGDGG
jgi:hypothetical protein